MSKTTLITSRDDKGRHAVSIFEAAYNAAKLDAERAQRLNERGHELRAAMDRAIAELAQPNRYAREEIASTFDYPPEYRGPAPLDEQAAILRAAFPGLRNYDHAFAGTLDKVEGTEGLFLVPRFEKVAQSYGEAVERVLRAIADTRKFTNYREGQFGGAFLRQHERTMAMLKRACQLQQGDLLVLPGQFGKEHRGRSVRRARELFVPTEFGGDAFAVGCMTLTHPTRFVRWEQLHADCSGDEFSPKAGGEFSFAPYFSWYDGELGFVTVGVSYFDEDYGSVSFRLPE